MADLTPGPDGGDLARTPRLDWLLERLRREGRIDVLAAAGRLNVARETIRRDLRVLEEDGKLQRVHGGAVPIQSGASLAGPSTEPDLTFASQLWRRLPRTGTVLIGPGHGSTALAQAIGADPPQRPGLTILTRALDVAVLVSRVPTIDVYNLGGVVSGETRAQHGEWALTELSRFRLDLAVVWPDGISTGAGLSASTTAEAALAEAEVRSARRVIAIGDRHNVGRTAFVCYSRIEAIDELVLPADEALPAGALDGIAERGVQISRVRTDVGRAG